MKYINPIEFIILPLILILFFSCATCRVTSIEDAKYYRSQGYETRIAVYKVGMDGLIVGMGVWTHHAQAQVKVGDTWKWVNGGLQDEPLYSIDGEIYYWQPEVYEAYLRQQLAYR